MPRHRRSRPDHLRSPVVHWGAVPKQKSNAPMLAGDWHCNDCGTLNYARREKCYVCHTKPDSKRRCTFDAQAKLEQCKFAIRPGDWQCTTCGSICYARRNKCFHCFTCRDCIRPIVRVSDDLLWHGDWLCAVCGFHNYKGRTRCHGCRARA